MGVMIPVFYCLFLIYDKLEKRACFKKKKIIYFFKIFVYFISYSVLDHKEELSLVITWQTWPLLDYLPLALPCQPLGTTDSCHAFQVT